MGSCCTSRSAFEDCLTDFFNDIPLSVEYSNTINNIIIKHGFVDTVANHIKNKSDTIGFLVQNKKVTTEDEINYIRETGFIRMLPESNYQDLVYKYLINKHYENESIDYFDRVYKMISYQLRYPILKLIIILIFSKKDKLILEGVLIENFIFYSLFMARISQKEGGGVKEISAKMITFGDLQTFLSYYLKAITQMTIPSLMKTLMNDTFTKAEKQKYELYWSDKVIGSFIDKTFFNKKDKRINAYSIDKFIKEYFDLLTSPDELRKDITEYAIQNPSLYETFKQRKISYDYKNKNLTKFYN